MNVPLAWLQLTREKRRFFAALAGISFAVVLMLTQLGFEDALMVSAGLLHSHINADLVLINPHYQFILYTKTLSERRLVQARGCDCVQSVTPVYVGQAPFKNPFDRSERNIFLIGFDPRDEVLSAPGVAENQVKLRNVGTVLFDSIRRNEFGPIVEAAGDKKAMITEVAGRQVEIAGFFQLGTSFGIDGTLVMSDETFLRVLPFRQRGIVDLGLIKLKPGADLQRSQAEIEAMLPDDVKVLTHSEFIELERSYWKTNTAIGFVFKLGVLMGMFVGCIIVYQILYSDVNEHLPEYATLKAMGYRDRYLFSIVMKQAVILSVFGFFPGVLISHVVLVSSRDATLLPLTTTWPRVATVYVLTFVICALSATLAMRRLKAADPAEIF
jgi:putative ABC transport system permease protein